MDTIPRVLSIAGTDPTGGAGVQADLKSIGAAGGYGMAVVTALVAQNTQGVREIHTPPQSFLDAQLQSVFDDVQVDAIKIGMLGDVETTETVANWLLRVGVPVVVLDPVMVATSGDRMLSEEAEQAVRELTRLATVVTPNLPELAMLVGEPVATTVRQAVEQAQRFAKEMNVSVLAKGGHLSSSQADNALVTPAGEVFNVAVERVETKNTHGTGCSLSSALATRLAAGDSPQRAVEWASEWLREAIEYADDLHVGQGNGPVDHFHRLRRLARSNGRDI
ncbi:bifunctional hydroxymethylpyrimidine kinase/phosphomethylpyrimidine kinase [Corynebacterium sp. ED61]|uniref:bifunctional hydroxymethylpyrimidine kinase/phosphomethylpyrimidine kinase n=1 Tax=Corynebacterium sp. ED61 TaxID=2211360 RepID=UPI0018832971|nr:bifunctional hydroxymethylpyrimidine kinase/phosphomethylpyrimidine kinase [Corynebacterium sp. ED61]MBF0580989.1 bifunctional hydroxymethylpyrimidine kinase/phosphomethylpyrimidine kinase [Corynebacterium sp. ED61]